MGNKMETEKVKVEFSKKDYNKNYYEKNKEWINNKIECECGSVICVKHKNRHFNSRIHKAFEKGNLLRSNDENKNNKER